MAKKFVAKTAQEAELHAQELLAAAKVKEEKPMWIYYDVEIQLTGQLVGGIPKNPEVYAALLRARGLEDLIPVPKAPEEMSEEEKSKAEEAAVNKSWVGFWEDEQGRIYLENRNLKALLKESSNIIKGWLELKNLKSKTAERVFVTPERIYLGVDKPDGVGQRVIHAITAQGPRSSLKLYDYVDKPRLKFRLKVLNDGVISANTLRQCLNYAQEGGLGADRSQEKGKFELISFTPLQPEAPAPVAPPDEDIAEQGNGASAELQ